MIGGRSLGCRPPIVSYFLNVGKYGIFDLGIIQQRADGQHGS